jgi:hypothetical protein
MTPQYDIFKLEDSAPKLNAQGCGMPCKSCGSVNQKKFSAEMGIHFLELKDIEKPVVWVFPEVVVCFNCGMAEFSVPKDELRQLEQSDSASSQ